MTDLQRLIEAIKSPDGKIILEALTIITHEDCKRATTDLLEVLDFGSSSDDQSLNPFKDVLAELISSYEDKHWPIQTKEYHRHVGSSVEEWLNEEGIAGHCDAVARKRLAKYLADKCLKPLQDDDSRSQWPQDL